MSTCRQDNLWLGWSIFGIATGTIRTRIKISRSEPLRSFPNIPSNSSLLVQMMSYHCHILYRRPYQWRYLIRLNLLVRLVELVTKVCNTSLRTIIYLDFNNM